MSFTPLAFSGVSSFSQDFQEVLKRAVDIASLPVKNLQNRQVDLIGKKQAFSELRGVVAGLATALEKVGKVGKNRALAATSSAPEKLKVTNVSASNAASYVISDVTSLAKVASETSAIGYETSTGTPVSASGTIRLTFGNNTYTRTLEPGENNLQGIRAWINGLGIGVKASVLTTGTGENPNFLSLSTTTPGATTLQLVDDPGGTATALITANNQGADTVFKLNGVEVRKKSAFVNDVIPGVTLNLLAKTEPGEEFTVNLSTSRSEVMAALQDLVTHYNSVSTAVKAQVGEGASVLTGQLVVRELQGRMRKIAGYQGEGAIDSLAEMGLEFDATGKLSLNTFKFDALTDTEIEGVINMMGSETTGLGALQRDFKRISDPIDGMIAIEQSQIDKADKRLQDQIAIMLERVSNLQKSVSQRLQYSDTLLARLEGQQKVVDASLQSLSLVIFGKKDK